MSQNRWYLEGYVGASKRLRRVPLYRFPFQIGRHQECDLTLDSNKVSRHHAKFDLVAGQLLLRDLGSTNGCFVNHRRIVQEQILFTGDVIHFADQEYRLVEQELEDGQDLDCTSIRAGDFGKPSPQIGPDA
ncbi:MAG: FHA domain-containing protein [Thermochromatium sp.]